MADRLLLLLQTLFLFWLTRVAPPHNASLLSPPSQAYQGPIGGFGPDFFNPPEISQVVDEVAIYLAEPVFHVEDPIA